MEKQEYLMERELAERFVRRILDRTDMLCSNPGGATFGTYIRELSDYATAEHNRMLEAHFDNKRGNC